jgi:hypothetical protein
MINAEEARNLAIANNNKKRISEISKRNKYIEKKYSNQIVYLIPFFHGRKNYRSIDMISVKIMEAVDEGNYITEVYLDDLFDEEIEKICWYFRQMWYVISKSPIDYGGRTKISISWKEGK